MAGNRAATRYDPNGEPQNFDATVWDDIFGYEPAQIVPVAEETVILEPLTPPVAESTIILGGAL